MNNQKTLGGSIFGTGSFTASKNGKSSIEYQTWRNMLNRCYTDSYHESRPKAIGCEVDEEWLVFQEFAAWLNKQEHHNLGYFLDKDLLVPGNKIYGAKTCLLLPREINSLIANGFDPKNGLPIGVYKRGDKFFSRVSINGVVTHIGTFNSIDEAFNAYVSTKEAHVKLMAATWRDRISSAAFDALMRWQVPHKINSTMAA